MQNTSADVDPRVLGKILLMQSSFDALPTSTRLSEFLCRGLEGIPGSSAAAVKLHDVVISSESSSGRDFFSSDICKVCSAEMRANTSPGLRSSVQLSDPFSCIRIQTIHNSHGCIVFKVHKRHVFAVYEPFLENLANIVALTLENREHEQKLRELNQDLLERKKGLESLVKERTQELIETNRSLVEEIEQRKRMEEELRQSQKMEAIGTLAGGIAHDFNNILTALIGHTEMAQLNLKDQKRVRTSLAKILNATKRASDLVTRILTFCRQTELETKPVKIQVVVREALSLLRSTIPATIEINHDIDPNCEPVLADPTQIHQIIMNLCTNAYHAMRDMGGTLKVTVSETLSNNEESRDIVNMKPGRYIRLDVSDTGDGIDSSMTEKIFDPYFTTKPRDEGTGLGLAVVRGIIQSLDGYIRVVSVPGKGATFMVFLPVSSDAGSRDHHVASVQLLRGKESIWIVDNEKDIVDIEHEMLESLGYSVTPFTDSENLLKAFEEDPEACDLVITDMTMPNMTGVELAQRLLSLRTNIPIILCTGFNETINRVKAENIGITEYCQKPYFIEEISSLVRKVLDNK